MFHFTSLLGAQSDSPATQSLVELDNGIKILIDVGWDSTFSLSLLSQLEILTPSFDLILLTHPTIEHMGAYAHACKHIAGFSTIPVYSTFPVSNLGRLLLQDLYLSNPLASTKLSSGINTNSRYHSGSGNNGSPTMHSQMGSRVALPDTALKLPPTPAEIDSYCGKIVTLKYSQPTPLHSTISRVAGKLGGVTISAYSAGHSLGGTIWKIQQAQESIIYAVDWNLSSENCLRGAAFLGRGSGSVQDPLRQPTAMVCSAKNANISNITGGRKRRDELLLEAIYKTAVENKGTVLIPTDSVGRVLELAYLLEHAWRKDPVLNGRAKGKDGVGLFMAGKKSKRMGQVIGSMLEWMDEGVVREFESGVGEQRSNWQYAGRGGSKGDKDGGEAGPFDFLNLSLISTHGHLMRALDADDGRGKVLIASDSSLDWGFARDALLKLADNENNLIILTERGENKNGLAGRIWQGWSREGPEEPGEIRYLNSLKEHVTIYNRQSLQGEQLHSYQRHLEAQKALNSQHQSSFLSVSALPTSITEQDDEVESSSSEEDSDSERQGKALTAAASKRVSTIVTGDGAPNGTELDVGINILVRRLGVYDYDVRLAKGRNRMFPYMPRRRRVDEYGEVIRPEEFMKAEERMGENGDAGEEGNLQKETHKRVIGVKRKWQDVSKAKIGRENEAPIKANTRPEYKRRKGNSFHRSDGSTFDVVVEGNADDGAHEADINEDNSVDEDEPESLSIPASLTSITETFFVRMGVTFIDFAGLHDQKALRMLLPMIEAKKLILVGAGREETNSLADFCREKAALSVRSGGGQMDVYIPAHGEKVNASVDTNAWDVRLNKTLAKALKWQNVRGLGVVHIFGHVLPENQLDDDKVEERASDLCVAATHVLDILPPNLAAATRSVAQPLHVGDIRVADLRRALQGGGHVAEFKGEGVLLVDGVVVVKKTGIGSVVVEDGGAGFSPDDSHLSMRRAVFMAVRKKVYEALATVRAA